MRNKHPGICYKCGKFVAKNEGHFERHNKGWRVIHVECVFQQRTEKSQNKSGKNNGLDQT